MLTNVFQKLEGKKTFLLSGLGALVALAGHFFGPFDIAGINIPKFDTNTTWNILWNGGLFAALRKGIK